LVPEKPITVLLNQIHKRKAFTCSNLILDAYLHSYALQDIKRNLCRVYVLETSDGYIKGFYTLSASSFSFESLNEEIQKKLPKYPLPSILLGRLAVDISYQKRGIGEKLLMDALYRVRYAQESVGIYAIVVDAKDEITRRFYEKYGFIPFQEEPLKLFLPISTLKQIF